MMRQKDIYIIQKKIEKKSLKDSDEYIKEYVYKYLIDHRHKLTKIFRRFHNGASNAIQLFLKEKDKFAYCQILKYLSSLPSYLYVYK